MTFASVLVADKWGRRVMLLSSQLLMAFTTLALGIYFAFSGVQGLAEMLVWLPITSIGFFILGYGIGQGPLVHTIIGEVCAPDIKGENWILQLNYFTRALLILGFAIGVALSLNWFLAFCITKFFSNLVELITIGPTFWIFSGFSFVGAAFVYFFVPETKGW